MSTKSSYTLKQTCSWKLHVNLIIYDVLVDTATKDGKDRLRFECPLGFPPNFEWNFSGFKRTDLLFTLQTPENRSFPNFYVFKLNK